MMKHILANLVTVECLTVPLWYKQQVTFLNPKFNQIRLEIANFWLFFGLSNHRNVLGIVQLIKYL